MSRQKKTSPSHVKKGSRAKKSKSSGLKTPDEKLKNNDGTVEKSRIINKSSEKDSKKCFSENIKNKEKHREPCPSNELDDQIGAQEKRQKKPHPIKKSTSIYSDKASENKKLSSSRISGSDVNKGFRHQCRPEKADYHPEAASENCGKLEDGQSSTEVRGTKISLSSFLYNVGGIGISLERAKKVLFLGGPVIIGMLTQTAVNLVDTAMVGRLPSDVSIPGQAALGLSLPIFWAIGGFLSSIQIGTQAIVARRYGEGNKASAGQALMNSLTIGITASAFVSFLAILLVPLVFPIFHSDPEVIRWGIPYLQIRLVATSAMVATLSIKGFFDGIGRTYVHMSVALVMNLFNIFGNWVLIFGNLGAPRMMVSGAALASAISTALGLLIIFAWTMYPGIQRAYRPYRMSHRDINVLKNILRISIPSGIATVAMMSAFLIFMKIGAGIDGEVGHGPVYTAATKVVLDILSVTFMSCIAFGTATATLVGQSLGMGKTRRAELFGWESMKMGLYFFTGLGLITLLWPDLFLEIFSKDPEVIAAGRPVLRLLACVKGLIAASLILVQANFGAGNSKFVMKVELFLHFICLIPLAYILGVSADLGILGMWLAVVVYVLLLSFIMGYKFHQGKWKEKKV